MTSEKFISEISTVTKFVQIYCDDKHATKERKIASVWQDYNGESGVVKTEFHLCAECETLLHTAYKS